MRTRILVALPMVISLMVPAAAHDEDGEYNYTDDREYGEYNESDRGQHCRPAYINDDFIVGSRMYHWFFLPSGGRILKCRDVYYDAEYGIYFGPWEVAVNFNWHIYPRSHFEYCSACQVYYYEYPGYHSCHHHVHSYVYRSVHVYGRPFTPWIRWAPWHAWHGRRWTAIAHPMRRSPVVREVPKYPSQKRPVMRGEVRKLDERPNQKPETIHRDAPRSPAPVRKVPKPLGAVQINKTIVPGPVHARNIIPAPQKVSSVQARPEIRKKTTLESFTFGAQNGNEKGAIKRMAVKRVMAR